MGSLEKFKPQLRPGRLHPQGDRIIYETDSPVDQIILPIEMSDFLLLCNGEYSVGEIIELLYLRKGNIQFKTIHRTLGFLRARKFLVNGEDLNLNSTADKFDEISFLSFKSILQVNLIHRLFIQTISPRVFYSISMGIILSSIYCLQYFDLVWLKMSFLKYGGSYFTGMLLIFLGSSLLLSFKNILKSTLLLLLTGRAYNFSFTFNGLALYFHVKPDSLFLVSNRLYLTLFHLTVSLCYFPMVDLFSYFLPDPNLHAALMGISFVLFMFDLNPFQESEMSYFLRSIFTDDTAKKIGNYLNHKSLFAIINPLGRPTDQYRYLLFTQLAMAWGLVTLYVSGYAIIHNGHDMIYQIQNSNWRERLSTLFVLSFTSTITLTVVYNCFLLTYRSHLLPAQQKFYGMFRRTSVVRIEQFNAAEIMRNLKDLPLFNYFSDELLRTLITKSQIKEFQARTPVIVQGEDGVHLYVLLSGRLKVQRNLSTNQNQIIGEIHAPSIFGEVAVLEEVKRTADVIAVSKSIVLEVPANVLRKLALDSQYIRELDSFRNAIMVGQFFSSAPVFRDVSEDIVHVFTAKGKLETFQKDQVLFRQGDPGDGFFLLLRGTVGVSVNGNLTAKINQGGFFGEISMIAEVPRTATIYAQTEVQTLKINRDVFWEILSHDINMAMLIESVGEMRIKEDVEVIKSKPLRTA